MYTWLESVDIGFIPPILKPIPEGFERATLFPVISIFSVIASGNLSGLSGTAIPYNTAPPSSIMSLFLKTEFWIAPPAKAIPPTFFIILSSTIAFLKYSPCE